MKDRVEKILIETLREFNDELDDERLKDPKEKTKLYGANGTLDSLALVSFVTDVEEKIADEFDSDVILADEKAMSATTSPFRNVATLRDYIVNLLEQ